MDSGTNKGLFTLITVVIFGIFISLSYFLFQDEMKSVLADVLDSTSFMTSKKIDNNGLIPTDETYFTIVSTGDGTCKITDYNILGGKDVIIPSVINGLTVTSLGNKSFCNKGLTAVVIPDTVITLDNGYWSVEETFGVFAKNNLKTITIPNSVTTIGTQSFWYAGEIADRLTIGTNVKIIGSDSFIGNKLTRLYIPASVETINWHAFGSNAINELIFSENSHLTTIANAAFNYNQLKTTTFPKSLTILYTEAFTNNPLESVTIGEGVLQDNRLAKSYASSAYIFDTFFDATIIHFY